MKRRLPKLARWLAGVYLVYGLVVFFGSLGGQGHSWWPIMLYPVIWPLSLLFQLATDSFLDSFSPAAYDYVAAAFYICIGAIWVWWLGHLFSILVTRIFPFRDEKTVG
jgi:hypothetical protein